jgi:addiction module HigA family antidote
MSKSPIITEGAAIPDRVTTHPGEVLAEEFLKPLGLSVNALAMALRVPATRMGAIAKGERAVTADTALRLARFFGTSAEILGEYAGHARPDQSQAGKRQRHCAGRSSPRCVTGGSVGWASAHRR